jgi:hypothetical protein
MYFAGDIHTSKEVSGDWFSEQKEKMPKLWFPLFWTEDGISPVHDKPRTAYG